MAFFLDKIKTLFSDGEANKDITNSFEEDVNIHNENNIIEDSNSKIESNENIGNCTDEIKGIEVDKGQDNINSTDGNNIDNHDIDLANKPIDFLDLSERTRNALINHGILYLKDFGKHSPNIISYGGLRGLGRKAISELNNAFMGFEGYHDYSIEHCKFYIVGKFENQNPEEYAKKERNSIMKNINKRDIEIANDPIDVLGLSERTYNALVKNEILYMKDFSKYPSDIRGLSHLRGLGLRAISELHNAFKKYEGYYNYSLKDCGFYRYGKLELEDPDSIEDISNTPHIEKTPYFEIDNKKYYIYGPSFIAFEDMRVKNFLIKNRLSFYDLLTRKDLSLLKGAGRNLLKTIYNFNKLVLRSYNVRDIYNLELPYEEKLDFLFMFSGFYSGIPDFEKKIIGLRSDWFNKGGGKVTLEEIGQDSNLTRERIRQLQVRNTELYESYLELISDQVEKFLIEKIPLNSEYYHLYYGEIEYSSTFSISFLQKSFYKIFTKEYGFYGSNDFFFFFKLGEGILLKEVQILLNKIDKFYYTKKIKDQTLTYDIILKGITSDHNLIKPIIKYYLSNKFGIDEENGSFTFPFNKRNYDSLVMGELEKLDNPIHFSDLYKIICREYPQFKFREQTVHSALGENEDAINVGKGLYIHVKKRPFLKGLKTTEDVIVKYLSEKENKRATVGEIVYFVKQYKDVDSGSIEAVLNLNKYGNFVKINNKEFGLKGYW